MSLREEKAVYESDDIPAQTCCHHSCSLRPPTLPPRSPTVVTHKVQLQPPAEGAYGLARPARSYWKPTGLDSAALNVDLIWVKGKGESIRALSRLIPSVRPAPTA